MNLPQDFTVQTARMLDNEWPALADALETASPVSLRLNPHKYNTALPYERVEWCDTGYYLPDRPSFTFDPLWHAGVYYVQEAASMFLEQAIRRYLTQPAVCLDLCAAPGGKTTHLLGLLPPGSLCVANEAIRSRASILAESVGRWGAPNAIVTHNDAAEIGRLTHLFDLIVADLPCSGEGMFRKDRDSRNEWSLANVRLCAARQRRIVTDVWEALKPGGLLIYSTCTFNRTENEENLRYLADTFGAQPLAIDIDRSWGVATAIGDEMPAYRFFPHRTRGEGFFLAIVRKPDGNTHLRTPAKNRPAKPMQPSAHTAMRQWIATPDDYHIIATPSGLQAAFPAEHKANYQQIAARLQVVTAGIALGEAKGKDLIPHPALALSTALASNAFPTVELDYLTAIRFLRREAIALPIAIPKGYVLLTYRNSPIGFVKQLGNRCNNLYPNEWRIRTAHLPDEAPCIIPYPD